MKRTIKLTLALALALSLMACSSKDKTDDVANQGSTAGEESSILTGKAKGFGGEVLATVTVQDGKIIDVKIDGSKETDGIGTLAIDELPTKIVEAGSTEVDTIASATVTSQAIIDAVNNAMDPEKYPYE